MCALSARCGKVVPATSSLLPSPRQPPTRAAITVQKGDYDSHVVAAATGNGFQRQALQGWGGEVSEGVHEGNGKPSKGRQASGKAVGCACGWQSVARGAWMATWLP